MALPAMARRALLPEGPAAAERARVPVRAAQLGGDQRIVLLAPAADQLPGLGGADAGGFCVRGQGRAVHHAPEAAARRGGPPGKLLRLRTAGPRRQARAGALAVAAEPAFRPGPAGRVLR